MTGGIQEANCAVVSEVSETNSIGSRGNRWGRSSLDIGPRKISINRAPRAASLDLSPKSAASEAIRSSTVQDKRGLRRATRTGLPCSAAPPAVEREHASMPASSVECCNVTSARANPKAHDRHHHEAVIHRKGAPCTTTSGAIRPRTPPPAVNHVHANHVHEATNYVAQDPEDDPDVADHVADDFVLTRLSPCLGSSSSGLSSGTSWPTFSPGGGPADVVDVLVESFSYSLHPEATPEELHKLLETFPFYGKSLAAARQDPTGPCSDPITTSCSKGSSHPGGTRKSDPSLTSRVISGYHSVECQHNSSLQREHSGGDASTSGSHRSGGGHAGKGGISLSSERSSTTTRQGPTQRRTPRTSQDGTNVTAARGNPDAAARGGWDSLAPRGRLEAATNREGCGGSGQEAPVLACTRRMDFYCPPEELPFSGRTRQYLLHEIYGPGSSMGNGFSNCTHDGARRRVDELPC